MQEGDKNVAESSAAAVAAAVAPAVAAAEVPAADPRALGESARHSTEAVQEPVVNVTEPALNFDTQQQSNKKNRVIYSKRCMRV